MKTPVLLLSAITSFLLINADASASIIGNHVFLDPASQTVALGSAFSVSLKGENFAQGLDGGSVALAFNPTVLQADSVSVNTGIWNFANVNGSINNSTGQIGYTSFSQFGSNTANNRFDIATFSFHAIALGTSQLTLSLNNNNPFGAGGNVLAVNLGNAAVTAVPVPGAFWLFGSVLFGLRKLRSVKK